MERSLYPENQPETITNELENLLDESIPGDASKGVRFANYLIDIVAFYLIAFVVLVVYMRNNGKPSTPLTYLIFYSVFLAYYILTESIFHRTLGKLCTGTIVIKSDSTKLSFKDALLRSLARIVPLEALSGFAIPWHDTWTNTRVVKKAELYKKPTLY